MSGFSLQVNNSESRIAFVEFDTQEAAAAAVDCSGIVLGSLALRITPSKTPVRDPSVEEVSRRPAKAGGGQEEVGTPGRGQSLMAGPLALGPRQLLQPMHRKMQGQLLHGQPMHGQMQGRLLHGQLLHGQVQGLAHVPRHVPVAKMAPRSRHAPVQGHGPVPASRAMTMHLQAVAGPGTDACTQPVAWHADGPR
jgi:hypothetical protein